MVLQRKRLRGHTGHMIMNITVVHLSYFHDRSTYCSLNFQVGSINDPQSAQPISDSYLVEMTLLTTVQQVKC